MRIGYGNKADGKKYCGIILAAGLSSRMGDFKPLMYVDGRTALSGLVETIRGAGVDDILVVTGFSRDKLAESVTHLRIDEAYNGEYESGMFSSIKTGIAKAMELWPEKEGLLLFPVDCPIISIETIRAVMNKGDEKPGFVVPTFEGKKGHPLLVPPGAAEEILSMDDSCGLKDLIDRDPLSMTRIPVNDEGCVMDMDDPESYEEIKKFVSAGFRREKLSVTTARRRIIMVRHGETEQHEGPVFIGQYDVPLNDEGREQAEAAALRITDIIREDVEMSAGWIEGVSLGREPMPPIENIHCSDLSRARETAEAISEAITKEYGRYGHRPEVITHEGLREIALGEWDGRPVEEIREKYPEDFEARGRDPFAFKKGNDSENFYDMQYRVMKTLRHILAADDGKNVVIAAHSGVIRALENNLKGLRVDDEWEPLEKGEIRIWEAPPLP